MLSKIPLWGNLYGVPLELWTVKGLSYVASAFVKPLSMDKVTEEGSQIGFGKVCGEIKVKRGFSNKFDLKMEN